VYASRRRHVGVCAERASAGAGGARPELPATDTGQADASAGTPNVKHDGTALPGIPLPDISRGFAGIPRSAQPPLTASQRRILECTYRLEEANADLAYTLFVPTTYDPKKPAPLVGISTACAPQRVHRCPESAERLTAAGAG
jgi:hypothetical protein